MKAEATLVDLLDRVLDKGLVVQADVVISVAGIPLVGLNLRAALAGMETMLSHGLLKDWDQSIRDQAASLQGQPQGLLAAPKAQERLLAAH